MSPSSRSRRNSALLVAAAAILDLTFAAVTRGQSSASLLVKPWEADQTIEDSTNGYLLSSGHTKESDDRYHLNELESAGRVRLFPGKEASPRFGYDLTLLDSHTNHPGFPSQLLDLSVAGGAFVNETNGWVTGLTLGVGYAGSSPFAEGRAWYGRADLVIAKKISDTDAVGIGLDYDGHRPYYPDVPLPGFGYSHQFDPKLLLLLGAPLSSMTWKPIEHLRIHGEYLLFTDIDVNVGYEFVKHWTAFAGFDSRRNAFWIDELHDHKRLLFSQRRVEIGVRFEPSELLSFTIAGGYAFSTDFRAGWDYEKHTRRYLYASDEPYLRVGAELKF